MTTIISRRGRQQQELEDTQLIKEELGEFQLSDEEEASIRRIFEHIRRQLGGITQTKVRAQPCQTQL